MQVRARAEARTAHVADRLARRDLLVTADGNPRLVAVERGEAVVVIDHHEVAVAGHPAAPDNGAGAGRMDGRPAGDTDVDARMERPPPHSERARDRTGKRPGKARAARRRGRGAAAGRARRLRLTRAELRRELSARSLERLRLLNLILHLLAGSH